ncbi:MAG: ribosome biogenesis GTP-binding protein YihA/YsxC [Bacteroidota bacterium]|jgi:GTP-binding protein|uniref:ribosome biogenesis GTP-binding protein YihA/YsxC n=1 Tax=Candidatus Pollutiaquabacter sp. TaxID=3416354 RepID=UPI001A556977|nr:YihA family ribosome biogenesis GTP-binding protein [Bacteroidota bacterium]MBL7948214.1 YihA family ribosome biogenesis GTP-binding protein [Bacteroidia bacterium]MBP7270134.1 YihA family ribosome biogenesis GTP-binding protein [Bacteroidia bacterium]MBP7728274.1 YihA family ribosome biogenesis GTP-binding protein [Bacteroidia bacterium]MBP7772527.1 YihA family ribosome biogenesis GTP-binding protein [Bacteroidia bacterium]
MAGYTIRDAEFIVSNTSVAKCPAADRPEFAFIGRSNVGKSSLINMLTVRKGLAKTSATPGKTQLINHFLVNNAWYLVDLPGYGYARTSQSTKAGWDKMIRDYLLKRENLMTVFVLVDVRHEPQKIDVEFINWLGEQGVPFCIVFTKADKLSKQQVIRSVESYKRTLRTTWEELPMLFITSAQMRNGREEILDYILSVAADFKPSRKP